MKSEKGVTLTSLVVYMLLFIIIIGIITTISNHFYKNVKDITNSPRYVSEFNNFAMFFVADVKNNSEIKSLTTTLVEFEDGTKYEYRDNGIYRNETKIAKYIKSFTFTSSTYTENEFTKNIINVNTTIGDNKESLNRNIDFILKYW